MKEFANDIVKDMHKDISDTVTGKRGNNAVCTSCRIIETTGHPVLECPKLVCDTWVESIVTYNAGVSLNWGNLDIQAVKENHWEMAKLFQLDDCVGEQGYQESNIPSLFALMTNCNRFDEYFINKDHLFEIQRFHDHLLYSESFTCCAEKLDKNFQCVLAILRETKRLKDMATCKDMAERITQIQCNQEVLGQMEEKDILNAHVSELKGRIFALKDRTLKKAAVLGDTSAMISEYNNILEKVRQIEDTGHKFRCFIEMNLIQEQELMRELYSIIKVCRETCFEAEQQKTQYENTPGRPYVVYIELGRVEIAWEPPYRPIEHSSYEVVIYEVSSEDGSKSVQCKESTVVLETLKGDTDFTIKVRRVVKDDRGPLSIASKLIRTVAPAGRKYLSTGKLFKQGQPTVYTLPMIEDKSFRNQEAKLKKFKIGSPEKHCNEKRILFLGETESSQGTAVDYILNFALGINLEDDYRFTVHDRDTLKDQDHREYISEYVIYPDEGGRAIRTLSLIDARCNVNYNGKERDETTVQSLQTLFNKDEVNEPSSIDAICVFANIDDFQSTGAQRNDVERALAMFGKDLSDNICLVATCAEEDEQIARTLATELNIPEVLFADFSSQLSNEALWDRNLNCFRKFLNVIGEMKSVTFSLCKEVLGHRLKLKDMTTSLELQINKTNLMEVELEQEEEKANIYEEVVENLKQYESQMVETTCIYTHTGTARVAETFCINCNHRCHDRCTHTDDEDPMHCIVFDCRGYCRICPGECSWKQHKTVLGEEYQFVKVKGHVHKVDEERQLQYEQALKRVQLANRTCESLRSTISDITSDIDRLKSEIIQYQPFSYRQAASIT